MEIRQKLISELQVVKVDLSRMLLSLLAHKGNGVGERGNNSTGQRNLEVYIIVCRFTHMWKR